MGDLRFFCPDLTLVAGNLWSQAVLVSSARLYDLPTAPFAAYVIKRASAAAVSCQVATITEFSASEDEFGNPITLFDGERSHFDPTTSALSNAQNRIRLRIDGIEGNCSAGPVLVSEDCDARLQSYRADVELFCTNAAELPDFAANLAHLRSFEEQLSGGVVGYPRISDEILVAAKSALVGSGFIQPVKCGPADSCAAGAMALDEQLSTSPLRFTCEIYVFGKDCAFGAGSILERQVRWNDGVKQREVTRTIGRIESIERRD